MSDDALREPLAVIHRDGGHHFAEHGAERAVADAHGVWADTIAALESLEAEIAALREGQGVNQSAYEELLRAKKAAEAERGKMRAALDELTTCVEDGCFCSEMKMASAVDNARAALSETEGE